MGDYYFIFLIINITSVLSDAYYSIDTRKSYANPNNPSLFFVILFTFLSWVGTVIILLLITLKFIIKTRGT